MCCRERLISAYSTFCTRQFPLKASGSFEPCLFRPFGCLCDGCNGPWLKKFPCHFTCITSLCWAFWSLWGAFWFWSRCLQCLQCFFLKHKEYVQIKAHAQTHTHRDPWLKNLECSLQSGSDHSFYKCSKCAVEYNYISLSNIIHQCTGYKGKSGFMCTGNI